MQQGSALTSLLFAIVTNVVTEDARKGALHEILYAEDLVLMGESMKDLQQKVLVNGKPTGKQRNEGQHQQNKINGEWIRRKNIKK